MALQQCINNYCSNNKSQIDGDCHDLDYQAGNKIVIDKPPMPRCWCVCSCLSRDTPLATPDGWIKVQDVVVDQTAVLAAGLELAWTPKIVHQWSVASPGKWVHVIYLHYEADGEHKELIVTRDQLFLTYGGVIKAADKLALRDTLVDRNGQQVAIHDLGWGVYNGEFYEIATTMEPPNKNFDNHLILSAGVVTPDFAVQVFQDVPGTHIGDMLAATKSHPSVGTPEWLEQNGGSVPSLKAAARNTPLLGAGRFTQADPDQVKVPAHASDFLPPAQAKRLQKSAPKKPFDDPLNRQMVEYLLGRFQCLYPEVTYQFNWYDHKVNGNSWVDPETGTKNVYISGGLARIVGFDYEGLALVFGHELGHLYGHDIGPGGVTCEGEADYFGAKIVLRKFWFGERYIDGMIAAIKQFDTITGYLKSHFSSEETAAEEGTDRSTDLTSSGQPYPSIRCRRQTFMAAKALDKIPACAACPTDGAAQK